MACPDQLTPLSVFTLYAQPNSSGLVLSHGPPADQMPVHGHEEEWGEIASLLNDTLRRSEALETVKEQLEGTVTQRPAEKPGGLALEAFKGTLRLF